MRHVIIIRRVNLFLVGDRHASTESRSTGMRGMESPEFIDYYTNCVVVVVVFVVVVVVCCLIEKIKEGVQSLYFLFILFVCVCVCER